MEHEKFVSIPFTPAKKHVSESLIKEVKLVEVESLAFTKLEEFVMWANRAIAVSNY